MWPNPQETADLVTFTKKNPEWKTFFLCSVNNAGNPWELSIIKWGGGLGEDDYCDLF